MKLGFISLTDSCTYHLQENHQRHLLALLIICKPQLLWKPFSVFFLDHHLCQQDSPLAWAHAGAQPGLGWTAHGCSFAFGAWLGDTHHGESKASQAERTKMLLEHLGSFPGVGSLWRVCLALNLVPEDLLSRRKGPKFPVTVAHKPSRGSPE